jgi:hypothetical protein
MGLDHEVYFRCTEVIDYIFSTTVLILYYLYAGHSFIIFFATNNKHFAELS